MASVTLSQRRSRQSDYIATAKREPIEFTSRGAGRRAVVVSPELLDRVLEVLENQADVRDAALMILVLRAGRRRTVYR